MSELANRLIVVMGVAGCGKSSVGEALAAKLGGIYLEGDHLHPPQNIERMSAGTPLTDHDRWPWLDAVGKAMANQQGIVVAGCSALKKSYRTRLVATAQEPILFVYLDGSKELIAARMAKRTGHFMPTGLLDSQFETLEVPDQTESALSVDISGSLTDILDQIVGRLGEMAPSSKSKL